MEHEREFLMRMGIPYYDIRPDFPPTPVEEEQARAWLDANGVQREKLVVVHSTSRWLFKCSHDERVAEVIDWLTEQGWPTTRLASAKGFRVLETVRGSD